MVKLLLDENLSPRAVIELRADGYDVAHLRERGRLGIADPEVLELALAEDRVLVTANVGDFRKLAVPARANRATLSAAKLIHPQRSQADPPSARPSRATPAQPS